MKKTTIKTKMIAGVLSAVTVFSVGTMAIGSASAVSTGSDIGDGAYAAGVGAIRQYVPGGQSIAGVIDVLVGALTKEEGPTLSDIGKDIADLRSDIDRQFSSLKNQINNSTTQIENKIIDQTVIANKGDSFDKLLTSMKETASQINSLENDKTLNDEEKAVEIAALIGRNDSWTNSSNVHNQYLSFMNTLSSSSFSDQKNRDFAQVVYNDCKSKVMFSGEAMDAAKPYLDRVVLLGLYAYSIDSECLKAALDVSKFNADDEKKLDSDALAKYRDIKSRTSVVDDQIKQINDDMFNTKIADSVATHYIDFNKTSRTIFINKNTCHIALKTKLGMCEMSKYYSSNGYLESLCFNGTVSHANVNALIAYVKSAYPAMTMRDYLSRVGFDMSGTPKNAFFVTGDMKTGTMKFTKGDPYMIMEITPNQLPEMSIDDKTLASHDKDAWRMGYCIDDASLSGQFAVNFSAA